MTGTLEEQTSELVTANEQLDTRRRFTEAVLAGVTAGVFGLDSAGRITLVNRSNDVREIELTSYAEVVLAPLTADLAHPAFSNLFVQTEILRDSQAILCTRRSRSRAEEPPWMFHLMVIEGAAHGDVSYETDRMKFIGRGRTLAAPGETQALRPWPPRASAPMPGRRSGHCSPCR